MNAESKPSDKNWLADPQPSGEGWSRQKIIFLVALVFAAHLLAVFSFGSKKPIVPRAAKDVPRLQLAGDAGKWTALENPALFALPNQRDFAAAIWLRTPAVTNNTYRYNESPHYLPLPAAQPGATFRQFMRTNPLAEMDVTLKPSPEFSAPVALAESLLPQRSRLKILGTLAQRKLLASVAAPTLTNNDVIPSSRVQALVDADGEVISAVLLPPSDDTENFNRNSQADARALELARRLRFAPSAQLTLGEMIFIWRTVPEISTNTPAKK